MNKRLTNYSWILCTILLAGFLLVSCAGQQTRKNVEKGKPQGADTMVNEAATKAGRADEKKAEKPITVLSDAESEHTASTTEKAVPTAVKDEQSEPQRIEAPAPPSPSPVPRPVKKVSQKASQEEKGPKIVLNFDNADLYAVISTIAELLEINYIVDPQVSGKVTINTAGGLQKEDLLPLFFQILEVNGLTAIQTGNLYKIMPLKDSPRGAIYFSEGESPPPQERTMLQIIPLKYISAQEMTKIITPFISEGGTIVSDTMSNTLLVVDKGINIMKVMRLVKTFDVNMFERVHYRFYPLEYLDAEEVAQIMGDFSASYGEIGNAFIKFIAITRVNTLLVVSTTPLVFDKVEEILKQIDVVDKTVQPRIYVYFVKNGQAKDLEGVLTKVFTGKSSAEKDSGSKGFQPIGGNPFSEARMESKRKQEAAAKSRPERPAQTAPQPGGEGDKGSGTGSLRGEVEITADEVRNALLIEATPADYRIIEGILRKIDVLPRQVLIEATIAEISIDTSTEIGMEWALGKGAALGNASFAATLNKLVGEGTDATRTGLQYSIGVTDKWYAALNAMASEGKVNILSSPHVLASDNKEAKIDVSREIPVSTGETTYATSTAVTETSIEYRDTGVMLGVTPHINERGLVTMEISEEVSDLQENVQVAGKSYPSFFKRSINTTLTVKHGQTIAIGGLIKDREEESVTGLPCLINIPIIRYLTGQTSKSTEKQELIVLLTPRVIVDLNDVDEVTDEFKQKVKNVIKRFNP
ncbi:MAG: type II secretion system secretin GspD [Deltaproteobacteria bacterium]|nr:type II secretion system secretin GspD [Deltaproteobacteria bacterium]